MLVDGEVEIAIVDRLQRRRKQIEAAGMHAFGGKAVLLHRLADRHRAARVDREHAFDVLVSDVIGVSPRNFLVDRRPSRDLAQLDLLARRLDRVLRAIETRLNVELSGRCDKADDLTLANQLDNAAAERLAGGVEILPDIGEAIIALGVGVVRKYRDPRLERLLDRLVERPCGRPARPRCRPPSR